MNTGILRHDFDTKQSCVVNTFVNKRNAVCEVESLVMDFIQAKDGTRSFEKGLTVYNRNPSSVESQKTFSDIKISLASGHYVVRDAQLYPNTLEVWEKVLVKTPGWIMGNYKEHNLRPVFSLTLIQIQKNIVNVPLSDDEYYDAEEYAHWKVSVDTIAKCEIFTRLRTMARNDKYVDILMLRGNFPEQFVNCSMANKPVPKKESVGHSAVLEEMRLKHKEMNDK